MPVEKPSEFTTEAKDFVRGDEVVCEEVVEKPYGDAPKTWWRVLFVMDVTHDKFKAKTLAETWVDLPLPLDKAACRKPWADELVRNLIIAIDRKKRLGLSVPQPMAAELGRLKARNHGKPMLEWK